MGWLEKYQNGGNIPKKRKKIHVESKGYQRLLQDNGDINPEKDYMLNYINSPKYKERLQSSGYSNVDNEINKRRNNVKNSMLSNVPTTDGSYYDSDTKNIHLDSGELKTLGATRSEIISHELGHAELDQGHKSYNNRSIGIRDTNLNMFDNLRLKHSLKKDNSRDLHDSFPDENKADLNSLRYQLYKEGIYDAGTEDFTKDHLKKSKNSYIKERLLKNYKEDDLIWLMNNIADNSKNTNVNIARNGGNISNNGIFDMTNPNIYKAVVPGAIGIGAATQTKDSSEGWLEKYQRGGFKPKDERLEAIKSSTSDYKTERQIQELKNIKEDAENAKKNMSIINPKSVAYKRKVAEMQDNQGEITEHTPQSKSSKAWEVATNPITAFGYAARNEDLPDNFSRGERNMQDDALDLINPAFYLNEAGEFVHNVATGHPLDAGMNALNIVPLAMGAKTLGKMAKTAERTYDTARGGVRNIVELNAHNPTSIYHNVIRQPIDTDKTKTAMFRSFYNDLPPAQATKGINQEVNDIIDNLKPGQQFRESSLSADSFRLLTHKAGALKNEFKVIPTKSYQPLNGLSNLRKDLYNKIAEKEWNDISFLSGTDFDIAFAAAKSQKQVQKEVNQEIIKKLTPYTERLAKQTGKKIPPPKIIAGEVHIPQIILERKGGSALQSIPRYGKFAQQTSLGFGVGNMVDVGLGVTFDDYESEISKLTNKQKEERTTEAETKWAEKYAHGGIIEDDRGQWHPGKVTKINSNNITMRGVDYPVLGISDTGDTKLMQPNKDYKFKGESVTEYPLQKSNKSSNFTSQNWLDKY